MSQSAISMALTAAPHGLKPPRTRMRRITRSTSRGSCPTIQSLSCSTMRLQVGLWRLDLAPAGDALVGGDRITGLLAMTAHLTSVIFIGGPLAVPTPRRSPYSGIPRGGRMASGAG